MRKDNESQLLDLIAEELLSTREGTEVYLQCLLRAVKEACTHRKYKQIANKHLELIQEAIKGDDDEHR